MFNQLPKLRSIPVFNGGYRKMMQTQPVRNFRYIVPTFQQQPSEPEYIYDQTGKVSGIKESEKEEKKEVAQEAQEEAKENVPTESPVGQKNEVKPQSPEETPEAAVEQEKPPPQEPEKTEAPPQEEQKVTPEFDSRKKIAIFGGSGFLGSRICKEALNKGLEVCSISRSGMPTYLQDQGWSSQVNWVQGDALNPSTYEQYFKDVEAVVSSVGLISPDQNKMAEINGTANQTIIDTAAAQSVERFVYISARHFQYIDQLIPGYFGKGKYATEEHLFSTYPLNSFALQPGFIYGDRHVGKLNIPLSYVGQPLDKLLGHIPNIQQIAAIPFLGLSFTPPLSVDAVAKTAVAAATGELGEGGPGVGAIDVFKIKEFAEGQ